MKVLAAEPEKVLPGGIVRIFVEELESPVGVRVFIGNEEAEILGATDFPPLKRTLPEYTECGNDFHGVFKEGTLAGVVEVDDSGPCTHIQSLVVHPEYFRLGLGSLLVSMVLSTYDSSCFNVETGLEKGPASELYLKLGFRKTGEYDTDHGVRKVQFELSGTSGN